ncbi:unnamed protein product, partial [Didymodactylos carnosus]
YKTDDTAIELRKFDEQIVYRALNTQETPNPIVTHCCKGRLRPNQTRRQRRFSIDLWNMYHRTTKAVMRTNNAAEAYHRRIGSGFQCSHPTL